MGIFDSISHAFKSAAHAIGNAFHSAESTVSHDADSVTKTIKTTAQTIYSDGKEAAKTVYQGTQQLTNKLIDTGKGIVDNTESSIKNIISMPLILIGAAVIVFAYNSRGNFQASYNR